MRETMFGKTPPVLSLKDDDVFAEKPPLRPGFQIKQGDASHNKALLGPSLPSLFNQLRFIVQFLPDEVGHRGEMVLAPSPAVRSRFAFGHGRFGSTSAVHALD